MMWTTPRSTLFPYTTPFPPPALPPPQELPPAQGPPAVLHLGPDPLDPPARHAAAGRGKDPRDRQRLSGDREDRKSTHLNSSHANISYAVFCLKKNNLSDTLS